MDADKLRAALEAIESARATLGDAAVEAAKASLVASAKAAADEAPGERKLVSALFADFAGFTSMVATGDPERVRELVGSAFEAIVPEIEAMGGTIEKFAGDGVMALFGAPVSHGDDARRACLAALACLSRLEAFNEKRGSSLALHVGVGTGIVIAGVVGPAGHRGYAALGDAVNRAARLCSVARSGQVIVDAPTRELAGADLAFEGLAPVSVKGFAEPVAAFALSRGAPPAERAADPSRALPFVGREAELDALLAALRPGRTKRSLAIVTGEPGIGKSRLLEEAFARLGESERAAVERVDARLYSYDSGSPFALWTKVAEALSGASPCDARDRRSAALEGFLRESLLPSGERSLLLRVFGVPPSDEEDEDPEGYASPPAKAIASMLAARAGGRKLVLSIDGYQWCDAASRDALRELCGDPSGGTYPGEAAWVLLSRQDSPPWPGARGCTSISLGPLEPERARELAVSIAGSLSLPVPESIERAAGNPFYVRELVRRSGGTVGSDPGLFSMVSARIDAMPERARRAAKAASVIGDEVPTALLAALVESPDIASLVEADVVEEAPSIRAIRFRHSLEREAVYESLLDSERRQLHAQAAKALKDRWPEYARLRPKEVGRHWELAGEIKKALPHYKRAAEFLSYSNPEPDAAELARHALRLAESCGSTLHQAEFLELLGRSLSKGRHPESALEPLARAKAIHAGLCNRTRELSIARATALALARSGRAEEAREALLEALDAARAAGTKREETLILADLAWNRLSSASREGESTLAAERRAEAIRYAEDAVVAALKLGSARLKERAHRALEAATAEPPPA